MKVLKIILSITLPIVLLMLFASLLTTRGYLLVSKGQYESHSEITFDHDYVADRVMGYLNYRYDDLLIGPTENDSSLVFRDTEISHMVDVKNLYTALRLVALVSLLLSGICGYILFKQSKSELYKTLRDMYLGPMIFVFVIGGYLIIDFGAAFRAFHELFFTNDDWLLRYDDALIQLLPFNFWLVSASIILILFSVSIGGIHLFARKKLQILGLN